MKSINSWFILFVFSVISLLAPIDKALGTGCDAGACEIIIQYYTADGELYDSMTVTASDLESNFVWTLFDPQRYYQGPTLDPDNIWDPGETAVTQIGMGTRHGLELYQICDLLYGNQEVGAQLGDQIMIYSSNSPSTYVLLDYGDVYEPEDEQGSPFLTWWKDGSYASTELPQLMFAPADGTFGIWDMHETLPERLWHYYEGYPYTGLTFGADPGWDTTGLGLDLANVTEIRLYVGGYGDSNSVPSDPSSLGSADLIDGSWGNDDTPSLQFTQNDTDGDTVKFEIQIDDSSDYSSPVVDYESALAATGTFTFTVGEATSTSGGSYTTGEEGQTLDDGSYYWRVMTTDSNNATSSWVTATGTVAFKVDTTAPASPSVVLITADSSSQLTVSATGTDSGSGIGYFYFAETSGNSGSSSSTDWQASASFTDSGLAENTQYIYKIKIKDSADNASDYSATSSKYTLVSAPTGFNGTTGSASAKLSVDSFTNDTAGSSGYYFFRDEANSGWIQTNSWTDSGVGCQTDYTWSVKYRNAEGTETGVATLTGTTGTCPSSSVGAPTVSSGGSGSIYVNRGGEISKSLGEGQTVKVTFPSYSTKSEVDVSIEKKDFQEAVENNEIRQPINAIKDSLIDCSALSFGQEVEEFEGVVELKFTYTDEQIKDLGIDEKRLKVHWYNEETKTWEPLDSKIDTVNNTVIAHTLHFTLFMLMEPQEMDAEYLKSEILRIQSVLLALQTELQQKIKEENASSTLSAADGNKLTKYLYKGQTDKEVEYLQMFLKDMGADIYPEGLITGYFGSLTKEAVIRFQLKEGIITSATSSGAGIVGPKTRAEINGTAE
jgi:hypothetical protein